MGSKSSLEEGCKKARGAQWGVCTGQHGPGSITWGVRGHLLSTKGKTLAKGAGVTGYQLTSAAAVRWVGALAGEGDWARPLLRLPPSRQKQVPRGVWAGREAATLEQWPVQRTEGSPM